MTVKDLIEALTRLMADATADHEDDCKRIEDIDGPIAGSVARAEPVEVILTCDQVRACINAIQTAEAGHGQRTAGFAPR